MEIITVGSAENKVCKKVRIETQVYSHAKFKYPFIKNNFDNMYEIHCLIFVNA